MISSTRKILIVNGALNKQKTSMFRKILKKGYVLKFEGHMCFVVNVPMIDSSMFDLCDQDKKYDFFVSWIYTGTNYEIVMQSISEVDVSKIAKSYNGCGHRSEARFVCDKLPF